MPENEKPELTDETPEAQDIEVVGHSEDEDEEEDGAESKGGCIVNNSAAL
jgi:hypothetical protein